MVLPNCKNALKIGEHHIPLLAKVVPQAAGVEGISHALHGRAGRRINMIKSACLDSPQQIRYCYIRKEVATMLMLIEDHVKEIVRKIPASRLESERA